MNLNEVERIKNFYSSANSRAQGYIRHLIDVTIFYGKEEMYNEFGYKDPDAFVGTSKISQEIPDAIWEKLADAPLADFEDLAAHEVLDAYNFTIDINNDYFYKDFAKGIEAKTSEKFDPSLLKEVLQEVIHGESETTTTTPFSIEKKIDAMLKELPILDKAKLTEYATTLIKMRESEMLAMHRGERGRA